MILVQRPDPSQFFLEARLRRTEQERLRNRAQRDEFDFQYSPKDIAGVLDVLNKVFAGKCAYCESKLVGSLRSALTFFRPRQGSIQKDGTVSQEHYWWLSWEWSNLYLACRTCIQIKGRRFPTKANRVKPETYGTELKLELPLLLDPCEDNPDDHLMFNETGEITCEKGSERGSTTIEILKLDREDLCLARAESAKVTKELLVRCLKATETNQGKVDRNIAFQIDELESRCGLDKPFSGMTRQLVSRWFQEAASLRGTIYGTLPTLLDAPEWQALIGKLSRRASLSQDHENTSEGPVTETEPHSPEPTLDQTEYEEILQVIHDTGRVFERLPSTYAGKDEEALRDHLILQLEPRFKGSTTGETFNKAGKTDILIRFEKRNVFVAECKFWRGGKAHLQAIDQILSYLTWRDSKTALVYFIDTKEMTAPLKTIEESTPTHTCFVSTMGKKDESWFKYEFHLPGDAGRPLQLAVLCFHIPGATRRGQRTPTKYSPQHSGTDPVN